MQVSVPTAKLPHEAEAARRGIIMSKFKSSQFFSYAKKGIHHSDYYRTGTR